MLRRPDDATATLVRLVAGGAAAFVDLHVLAALLVAASAVRTPQACLGEGSIASTPRRRRGSSARHLSGAADANRPSGVCQPYTASTPRPPTRIDQVPGGQVALAPASLPGQCAGEGQTCEAPGAAAWHCCYENEPTPDYPCGLYCHCRPRDNQVRDDNSTDRSWIRQLRV